MRLLHTTTLELHHFLGPPFHCPKYAILSHMWGEEEVVTFSDLAEGRAQSKIGFKKIYGCCAKAASDGFDYVWIDVCCIDKLNSNEINETIISMYSWFESADICYAYLSDISSSTSEVQFELPKCEWFTRSWTLLELLAPSSVEFFDADWGLIGTKASLADLISEITGIREAVLTGAVRLDQCQVSEKMAWASNRQCVRPEDRAYCLMGLFGVSIIPSYGEGGDRAFRRLKEAIREDYYANAPSEIGRTGMRLLVTNSDPLRIRNFAASDDPKYAILSHTWGRDEVSFQDLRTGDAEKKLGYQKIKKCCELAALHGFEYAWVDTCCIDKTSSAELQEAICSMYDWYQNAQICYVYLEDYSKMSGQVDLWSCRWFRRGWTLQELIAPAFVEFYDAEWEEIGTKSSLCNELSSITGIDKPVLRGEDPTKRTVAERMSWAATRSTTRIEDTAYCLMGLFNVMMPMLYGEGNRAFMRLQEEILKSSEDYTLFAWRHPPSSLQRGILALSPAEFYRPEGGLPNFSEHTHNHDQPATMTSRGLLITLPLIIVSTTEKIHLAWVCNSNQGNQASDQSKLIICVWLQELQSKPQVFVRLNPGILESRSATDAALFVQRQIYVLPSVLTPQNQGIRLVNQRTRGLGTIRLHHPEVLQACLWLPDSPSHIGFNSRKELTYTGYLDTCALAALRFDGAYDFVVLIGFKAGLPWCRIYTFGLTPFKEFAKTFNSLVDLITNPADMNLTDRATRTLPNGLEINAAIRPAPCSQVNAIFNLHVWY